MIRSLFWWSMIDGLRFLYIAWRAYRGALNGCGSHYCAMTNRGVPEIAVFVGVGREAWRVSVRAVEEFK